MNSNCNFCSTAVTTTTTAKYFDSLGSSFCNFSSSISVRSYNGSASGRFGFSTVKKVNRLSCDGSSSSRNENWNRTQKQNQFINTKVVLNHRKEESFLDFGARSGENSSDGGGSRSSSRNEKWSRTLKQNQFRNTKVVLNHRKGEIFLDFGVRSGEKSNDGEGRNSGGSSTMDKIVERLKKYGFVDDDQFQDKEIEQERGIEKVSKEDTLYVEEGRGEFSEESSPFGVYGSSEEVKFPWEKVSYKKELVNGEWTAKTKSRYSLTEMTLSEYELN